MYFRDLREMVEFSKVPNLDTNCLGLNRALIKCYCEFKESEHRDRTFVLSWVLRYYLLKDKTNIQI